jgi:hypothetical protein
MKRAASIGSGLFNKRPNGMDSEILCAACPLYVAEGGGRPPRFSSRIRRSVPRWPR